MQSEAKYYGRAVRYTLSANVVRFDPRFARVHIVEATTAVAITTYKSAPAGTWFYMHSLSISAGNITIDGAITLSAGRGTFFFFTGSAWVTTSFAVTPGTSRGLPTAQARVYVVGGGGLVSSTFYTPATNVWAAGPNPATAKDEAAGALIGVKGYFIGTDPLGASSVKNDELDISLNTFTNRADYPAQVMRSAAAFASNASLVRAVFVYGGDATPAVWSFAFNAWTAQNSLPMKRARGVAVSVARQDGRERSVFLMGGDNPVSQPILGHNPRADFYWTATLNPGASRRSVAGFARAGRVHMVGGYLDSPVTRYDLNEEYAPGTDSWVTRAVLSLGQRYGGAGATGGSLGFYCGGRTSADAATATAASYIRDAWASIASMPAARPEVRGSGVST